MLQIAVVLAIYRPNADYLKAQLLSLKNQSHTNFRTLAVIADQESGALVRKLAAATGLEIQIEDPDRQFAATEAFEHGISTALKVFPDACHIALCDQDDIWYVDRLSQSQARLTAKGVSLVHSDARVVSERGEVLYPSMFAAEHRAKSPSLADLLLRNAVTGMTVLMTRDCAETALPFPKQSGPHFYHDLWLALVAEATDGIEAIGTPLVDYRQHGQNTVGLDTDAFRDAAVRSLRGEAKRLAANFARSQYLAKSLQHRVGQVPALGPFKRTSTTGIGHLWHAARLLLSGRGRDAKLALGHSAVALGRRLWVVRRLVREGYNQAVQDFDARLYGLSPGILPNDAFSGVETRAMAKGPTQPWWTYFDPRTQVKWRPNFTDPTARCVVLVPSLNPDEIFAGIATALDMALGLAERGVPVRIVATDLPIASSLGTRAFLTNRNAIAHDTHLVEIACGVHSTNLPAHPDDVFLATAWWTAQIADELAQENAYRNKRFIYLIQDYEPGFYPWGDEYAGALASYRLSYDAVVNTTYLADFLDSQGHALHQPIVFQPSIDVGRYAKLRRPAREGPRHIALYGRPEVSRNMFHTSVQALGWFLESENLGPDDVRVTSVGLGHENILLPNSVELQSLGKLPWAEYPGFLTSVDIGLSLMLSPHPSHVPLEMAAAGARVVTNEFGPKCLSGLSPALLSAEPNVRAVTAALSTAWHAPPPSLTDRALSLDALGMSIDQAIDMLARRLAGKLGNTRIEEAA